MTTDVLIVGAGPAGLTAALYVLRAEKKVLLLERSGFGGQAALSPRIDNFPGRTAVSGSELADALVEQVLSLGGTFEFASVTGIRRAGTHFEVQTETAVYPTETVILACGARHRRLGVPNEETLTGRGVSFCAVCDGAFYKNKDVCVIGGGNSALQETLLLSELCRQVTVIQNLPVLTGEPALIREVKAKDNVRILLGRTVSAFRGDAVLTGLSVRADDREETLACDGAFVAVGLEPQNEVFADLIALDENGYIIAGEDCKTNISGIFAAGDCRTKQIRQITTACADGTVAALAACDYLRATAL